MNINAPNEDNLCFIKNVLEQGATLIDSAWLFFSFSQDRKLAHTHTHARTRAPFPWWRPTNAFRAAMLEEGRRF